MADLKPELSKKSKYWISRHRYYELKHFCLQYPEWKKMYRRYFKAHESLVSTVQKSIEFPTEQEALKRAYYISQIELIERMARETDPELANYILRAVTENLSFNTLKLVYSMPCERDMFYDRYRKFFWLLDKER